jgi:hypothetical protein
MEGGAMAKAVIMEPTAGETAALLAEIKQAFADMDLIREQMRRDGREIERSRARTQAILDHLEAILRAE